MTEEIDGCCPAAYVCPSSGEVECLTHGGFDCCCADKSCPGYRRLSPWRWLRWTRTQIGYWIRPYDDGLDARRWRWQRRGHVCRPFTVRLDPSSLPARPDPRGTDDRH